MFRITLCKKAGERRSTLRSRLVLALKHSKDGTEICRARFAVGNHKNCERENAVHRARMVKQSSTLRLPALASIFGFDVYTIDVTQAYLQSAEDLQRKLHIRQETIDLHAYELLQPIKLICGLTGSGDYWNETISDHQEKDLDMTATAGIMLYILSKSQTDY